MAREPGWFESRLPLRRWTREALTEDIPGGASYWYVFGSATTIVFAILAATGIAQLFFYVPSTERAYASVNYLRFEVPWGWLIHGLHFWAATAMVALALFHLIQVFVWGAFKNPRQLTWVLGGLLLLATLGAMFTGTPLPWDKRGYLAAVVAHGIAGSVPVLGSWGQALLWGGDTVGQLSLSRLFGMHVAVIPLVIAAILALHILAFREPGAAASFSEKRNSSRTGPFWPDQLLKDLIAASVVFVGLVGLSAFLLTPVTGAADPLDATYIGKPEWPFLAMYQVLKYVPGRLEALGIVGAPLLALVLLFGVPWFDRSPERAPQKRPIAMAVFALVVVGVVTLSVLGGGGPTEVVSKSAASGATETTASAIATSPATGSAPKIVGNAEHGATVYANYCESCHGPGGNGQATGEVVGPALNPIESEFVTASPVAFATAIDDIIQVGSVTKGKVLMPAFGASSTMTQQQIADVEAYILALNHVDRAAVEVPGVDPRTFFWVTLVVFGIADVAAFVALARRPRGPS